MAAWRTVRFAIPGTSMATDKDQSIRSSMISGSAWMIAMRWGLRGIGLVSTVILVRLLAPEDFGLVAMATLFIALLDVFTSFGVDMALIQRADATKEHFNTAWTIRLIQAVFIALLLVVLAPFLADYFNESRVTALTMFLAIGVLVAGLENIGIVAFRKELEFSKEFRFAIYTKFGSFFITIGLALWLRNYWALAWGIVGGKVVSVAMSYWMHPYRPRPSLARFRDLWSFSQWMLLRNIGMYLRKQVDSFLVARFFDTSQMGFYSVGKEVAELPTTDLVWPTARALFPGYAKLAHDPVRMGQAYLKVLNTIALFAVPIGLGLALVAEPLVLVAFGERWVEIAPVLAWLAFSGVFTSVSAGVQMPLIALNRMRRAAGLAWVQLVAVLPAVMYAVTLGDLTSVAIAHAAVAAALVPVFFATLTTLGIVSWGAVANALWRPFVAGAVMSACVMLVPEGFGGLPIIELVTKSALGAVTFTVTGFLLWRTTGQPDGGEKVIADLIGKRLAARGSG
ncbi:MAG: lipopolysaccharide biosynthesis protein [Pseudomonadota bacterium]